MLATKRYPVSNPLLKKLIKYFWTVESQASVTVNHKLLPECNIDFIFNFSSPIKYIVDGKSEAVPQGFHFHGVRDRYYIINSTGKVNVLGVSFFKDGLFPLLKAPLSEFGNNVAELDAIFGGFTAMLEEKLRAAACVQDRIDTLENELLELADAGLIPDKSTCSLLRAYDENSGELSVGEFCGQYGVNPRKLERAFNKYIGVSPKKYARIHRLKKAVDRMVESTDIKLTSFAYEHNYYDQTHFIKDFQAFTGSTPTQFLREKAAVKQIMDRY